MEQISNEGIVDVFKEYSNKLTRFIKGIFDKETKAINTIEDIQHYYYHNPIYSFNNSSVPKTTIKIEGLNKILYTNGTIVSWRSMLDQLENVYKLTDVYKGDLITLLKGIKNAKDKARPFNEFSLKLVSNDCYMGSGRIISVTPEGVVCFDENTKSQAIELEMPTKLQDFTNFLYRVYRLVGPEATREAEDAFTEKKISDYIDDAYILYQYSWKNNEKEPGGYSYELIKIAANGVYQVMSTIGKVRLDMLHGAVKIAKAVHEQCKELISTEGFKEIFGNIVKSGVGTLLNFMGDKISDAMIDDSRAMLEELTTEQFKDTSGNSVKVKNIENYVYSTTPIIKWLDLQSQLESAVHVAKLDNNKIIEYSILKYNNFNDKLPGFILGLGRKKGIMDYTKDGTRVISVQGTSKALLAKFIKTYLQLINDNTIDDIKLFSNTEKIDKLTIEVIKKLRIDNNPSTIKEISKIVEKTIQFFCGVKIAAFHAAWNIAKEVIRDMKYRYNKSMGLEDISNMENIINTKLPEEGGDTELVETDIQIMEQDIADGFKELEVISNDQQVIHGLNNIVKELEAGPGVDNTGAEIIVETLENIYRRHGIPRRYKSFEVPSLENLSNTSSKVDMARRLRVTLEEENSNTENAIKKAWNWICEQFGKLIDKVFNSFNKLGDKAKALADKIKNDKANMGSAKAYILTKENPDSKDVNDVRAEDEASYSLQVVDSLDQAADKFIEGLKNVGTDGASIPTMPSEDSFTRMNSWKTIKVNSADAALKALVDDNVGLAKQVEKFKEFSDKKKKPLFDALQAGQEKLKGNQANENTVKVLKANAEAFNKHIQGYTKVAQAIYNACEKFYSTWKEGNTASQSKEGNATNASDSTSAANAGAAK